MSDEPDGPTASAWGGPRELSAWEALMWRADGDPRTRSTGVLLERLDGDPDWGRLHVAMTRLVRRLPRLRDRIVEPPLPLVAPRWAPDPHFDLDYHLRRVRLPGDGSERELFDHIAADMAHPIDRHRPPWEATLITGLADGSAALAFKVHHCLSDGLGLVQLLELAHDGSHDEAHGAARTVWSGVADPIGSGRGVLAYASSLGRMLTPPPVDRTLVGEGVGYAAITHDVPLDRLRAAGKAAGGSVNDAFLAAVLGAFRRFHALSGPVPEELPLAFPISTRGPDDPEGGNRFSGVRFAAPLAEPDPTARIARIREFVRTVRTRAGVPRRRRARDRAAAGTRAHRAVGDAHGDDRRPGLQHPGPRPRGRAGRGTGHRHLPARSAARHRGDGDDADLQNRLSGRHAGWLRLVSTNCRSGNNLCSRARSAPT